MWYIWWFGAVKDLEFLHFFKSKSRIIRFFNMVATGWKRIRDLQNKAEKIVSFQIFTGFLGVDISEPSQSRKLTFLYCRIRVFDFRNTCALCFTYFGIRCWPIFIYLFIFSTWQSGKPTNTIHKITCYTTGKITIGS